MRSAHISENLLECRISSTTRDALTNELAKTLIEKLAKSGIFADNFLSGVELALHEAILNAVIHGNLELESRYTDYQEMTAFFEAVMKKAENPTYGNRLVIIEYKILGKELIISITNQGNGFESSRIMSSRDEVPHGRGMEIIKLYSKSFTFKNNGTTFFVVFEDVDT